MKKIVLIISLIVMSLVIASGLIAAYNTNVPVNNPCTGDPFLCSCASGTPKPSANLITNPGFEIITPRSQINHGGSNPPAEN